MKDQRAQQLEREQEQGWSAVAAARAAGRVWRRGRAAELELLQLLPPPR